MKYLSRVFLLGQTLFVVALASSLGTQSAKAQAFGGAGNNYYPAVNSPVDSDPVLLVIEAKLNLQVRKSGPKTAPVFSTPSLLVPTSGATPTDPGNPIGIPTGYVLANDAEIDTAVGQAVADKLNNVSGAFSGSIEDLIYRSGLYKPATVGARVKSATTAVLDYYKTNLNDAARLDALEQISRGASRAEPKQAAAAVTTMLKLVAPTLPATIKVGTVVVPQVTPSSVVDADNVVEQAIENSAANAEAIVKAAIGVVKTVNVAIDGTGDMAKALVQNVSAEALNTIFDPSVNAGYLGYKVALAIGSTVKGATKTINRVKTAVATSTDIVNAIFQIDGANTGDSYTVSRNLSSHPEDIQNVGLVMAGLMKGFNGSTLDGGTDPASNITTAVQSSLSLSGSLLSYTNAVKAGFVAAAAVGTDQAAVTSAFESGINSGNKNEISGRIIGALGWSSSAASLVVESALRVDASLGGAESIQTLVNAVVSSSPTAAAAITKAAVDWSKTTGSSETERSGKILQGVAEGLRGQPTFNTLYTAAVGSVFKSTPLVFSTTKPATLDTNSVALLTELARYGSIGAQNAGVDSGVSLLTQALQKAALKDVNGYKPIISGAIQNAGVSADQQWRAVLGSMSADKVNAAAIRTYAKGLANYQIGNDAPIAAGGDVIIALQSFPKEVFSKIYDGFAAPGVSGSESSALAVLNAASLINPTNAAVAAATAIKLTDASVASIRSEANSLNPAKTANTNWTIDVAAKLKAGTSDMFDYLEQKFLTQPSFTNDILIGATIVVPNYAHITAHALAFRQPTKVAAAVPLLFNYSHLTSQDLTKTAPLVGQYDNTVDAASAISAAVTSGIIEAKTNTATNLTKQATDLKNAVAALVKQAQTLSGNTPVNTGYLPDRTNPNVALLGEGADNFKQSDGTPGGFTLTKQNGSAGVITGFITKALDKDAITATSGRLTGLAVGSSSEAIAAVITASVKIVKSNTSLVLAVAQAASQAIKSIAPSFTGDGVSGTADGEEDLIAAIFAAFSGTEKNFAEIQSKVPNAVHFGYTQAVANVPGAGAAGVINYTQNTVSGAPVTDIFEL